MAAKLPQELIDKIAEHANETTKDILPLLLVSKSWKIAAERVLYRFLPVKLAALQVLKSNSYLATLVHILKLSCNPRLKNWESNLRVFSNLLLITPNVRSVDVIGPLIQNYTHNDAVFLVDSIRCIDTISQLKWLRIRYVSRFCGIADLLSSLLGWPEIEQLELHYSILYDNSPLSWDNTPVYCNRLRRLEIYGTKFTARGFVDLSCLKAPIEVFSVNGVENRDEEILMALFSCLENWAGTLQSLRLNGISKLERNSVESQFPTLPELVIFRSSFTIIHPYSLQKMPKLNEIDYIVTSSTENSIINELIEVLGNTHLLPNLEKIRLLGLGHDPEQIEYLTEVCISRSITIIGL